MFLQRVCAGLLLLSVLIGCASKAPSLPSLPEQNTRLVYPSLGVPLTCAVSPPAPAVDADDNAWSIWKGQDTDAGQDCREKLAAVKRVVDGWPKATDAVPK